MGDTAGNRKRNDVSSKTGGHERRADQLKINSADVEEGG